VKLRIVDGKCLQQCRQAGMQAHAEAYNYDPIYTHQVDRGSRTVHVSFFAINPHQLSLPHRTFCCGSTEVRPARGIGADLTGARTATCMEILTNYPSTPHITLRGPHTKKVFFGGKNNPRSVTFDLDPVHSKAKQSKTVAGQGDVCNRCRHFNSSA
jgi:hypothetical protein